MSVLEICIVAALIVINGLLGCLSRPLFHLAQLVSGEWLIWASADTPRARSRVRSGQVSFNGQIGITLVGILSGAFSGATIGLA